MDRCALKKLSDEDIMQAIDEGIITYAPAWWQRYGREIRKIGDIHLYWIKSFEIGEYIVPEKAYYLDGRILKAELDLNKKGHP